MSKNFFTEATKWCWPPEILMGTPCFVLFRRKFTVREATRIMLNVSADNRYNLFLDGKLLGRGPCRGDLQHYNYEEYSFDVAPGRHVIAAEVAVFPQGGRGDEGPLGEIHAGGGFIVAGGLFNGKKLIQPLDTPSGWKCAEDVSRKFIRRMESPIEKFIAVAQVEKFDASKSPGSWKDMEYGDEGWEIPRITGNALIGGSIVDTSAKWWLCPRKIPMMEEKSIPVARIFRHNGIPEGGLQINNGRLECTGVPECSEAKIVLDMNELTTAFPCIEISGAPRAMIKITYSESMFVNGGKKVRDDPSGEVIGYSDIILPAEGTVVFSPFWFRTFRFMEIEIKTADSPLKAVSVSASSFMYPFEMKARLEIDEEPMFGKIWELAWRTARLCAHEHYEDCPYYEQLQYTGDTRIQALISYAATGDGRLGKQAILQFDNSRLPEGITQSRYPSNWVQIIPGFSLFWIMMVYDHYMYFADTELVKQVMPGMRSVLEWFEREKRDDGLIGHLNYWNFTDWVEGWPGGVSSRGSKAPETINSLLYAEACRAIAFLCSETGLDELSGEYMLKNRKTVEAVKDFCRDKNTGLFNDMPGCDFKSSHVNSWALITGAANTADHEKIAMEIFSGENISSATLYFSFYLFRAWEKAGTYFYFRKYLEKWKSVFKWNFTTFPEKPLPETRSDCHGWSSSPIYEYITRVLGVRPAEPGFRAVLIKPEPAGYTRASGKVPAGKQIIEIAWRLKRDNEMEIQLGLEEKTSVIIEWPDGGKEKLNDIKSGMFNRKLIYLPGSE